MAHKLKFGNGTWATKKGSTLAYNDENDNYKPLPFTTTRDSIATRVNKEGLIEVVGNDIPRIDYTDSSDGVLLLENSATNRFLYSEDYTNSVWTTLASGETIVSNSIISPDGSLNADTLQGNGSATNVYVRQDVSLTASVNYTFSIFAKKGTNDFLAISAEGFSGATNTLLIFDLNNSIVTNGTGNIQNYGNGWLRCSFTTAISTDVTGRFLIYPAYNGTTRGFPTSSDANGQNIYLWGAMLEANSVASSYIPTSGSSVTRQADTASGSGNSEVFNDSEGVLFADISALANDSTLRKIQVNDNTSNNNITIDYYTSSNSIRANLWNGSSQYSYVYTLTDVTLSTKVAFLYKSSEFKFYVNGIKVNESSSGSTFSSGTLKTLDLSTSSGSFPFYGKTKEIAYYDTALTDEELEYLTSYRSLNELVTELNLNTL